MIDAAPTEPTEQKFVRLLPSSEVPRYAHIPGSGTPHPFRDPRGHSYDRKAMQAKPLIEVRWAENRTYLHGLDLFNLGFYWEAHDEWDRLYKVTTVDSLEGRFLKGLVKMAAAGMKVREESIHGVRRHAASAGEVFADVAAEQTPWVSFNGKTFDLPFLRERARFHHLPLPEPREHLDLLHAARRVYKGVLPNCRLQTLESALFARYRYRDLPGDEIPAAYHDYVRTGEEEDMVRILRHNRDDLVTLARLHVHLGSA